MVIKRLVTDQFTPFGQPARQAPSIPVDRLPCPHQRSGLFEGRPGAITNPVTDEIQWLAAQLLNMQLQRSCRLQLTDALQALANGGQFILVHRVGPARCRDGSKQGKYPRYITERIPSRLFRCDKTQLTVTRSFNSLNLDGGIETRRKHAPG
ncbi:hypothetical protein D3C79_848590 [compost metagenome]